MSDSKQLKIGDHILKENNNAVVMESSSMEVDLSCGAQKMPAKNIKGPDRRRKISVCGFVDHMRVQEKWCLQRFVLFCRFELYVYLYVRCVVLYFPSF